MTLDEEGTMELSAFTWYDILGVLPVASTQQINEEYGSKASLLQPAHSSGAPSRVIAAASRAQQMLDTAWRMLGDPASRRSYDEATGIRRIGDGLAPADSYASQPSLGDVGFVPGSQGAEALGFLMALTDWLAPHPHPARRLAVPDVRRALLQCRTGHHGPDRLAPDPDSADAQPDARRRVDRGSAPAVADQSSPRQRAHGRGVARASALGEMS